MAELKFHEPTGAVPPPFVLVEGEEKAGKSTEIAKFTGCDRIGQTYWIELGTGERTGEWYIRVHGAKYLLANHDAVSTWRGLNEQVDAIAEDVKKRLAAGEKTPMIVVDSMTAEWKSLSKWAEWRARNSRSAKRILERDPNAEITVGHTYWNPATARHEDLLSKLSAIPAIIVFTARGREVTEFGKDGNPVAGGKKTWSVAAQKDLGFFVDCWVRMYRGGPTELVSCRSITDAVVPDVHDPEGIGKLNLEQLIFERYGFDPNNTMPRPDRELDANQVMPGEQPADDSEDAASQRAVDAATILGDARKAETAEAFRAEWGKANDKRLMDARIGGKTLVELLREDARRFTPAAEEPAQAEAEQQEEPAETKPADAAQSIGDAFAAARSGGIGRGQKAQLGVLFTAKLKLANPATQLALATALLKLPEPLADANQLTHDQAVVLMEELRNIAETGDPTAVQKLIASILNPVSEPVPA